MDGPSDNAPPPSLVALRHPAARPQLRPACTGGQRDLSTAFGWAYVCLHTLVVHLGSENLRNSLLADRVSYSTHFSGVGTVELSVRFLQAAWSTVLGTPFQLKSIAACEKKPSNRALLLALSAGEEGCVFEDILARSPTASSHHAHAITAGTLEFSRVWACLRDDSPVCDTAGRCSRHLRMCTTPRPLVDVSGSPCTPWSSAGRRSGRCSPVSCLFLAWCQWARFAMPLVLVHENVVGWDSATIQECLGDLYEVRLLRVRPADAGFPFLRRERLYAVLFLRGRVRVYRDVATVYKAIVGAFRGAAEACPPLSSIFVATSDALLAEENRARRLRGLVSADSVSGNGWEYLLTEPQQARVQESSTRSSPFTWWVNP